MTPDQTRILRAALSGFHQDFGDDYLTQRDVLAMHARGLDASLREGLYSAFEALLSEATTHAEFFQACGNLCDYVPDRSEVESFVAWARTPEGAAAIAALEPMSGFTAVNVDLSKPIKH